MSSLATASAIALGTAACAPPLAVRAPRAAVPAAFDLAAPVPPPGTLTLDRWWRSFDDPALTRLVERALDTGVDARLALARLAEARAVRSSAVARLGVQGDVQASVAEQRARTIAGGAAVAPVVASPVGGAASASRPDLAATSGESRFGTAGFALSYDLDLFGGRAAVRRGAAADLAAARFAYEGARAALAAEVVDTLFVARGLAAQRGDARAAAATQRSLRDVLASRAARGLGADAEVARVDADLARSDAEVVRIEAELVATRRSLLILTGDPSTAIAAVPVDVPLADPPVPPALVPGDLLVRRPDVREADARFRAAVARAQVQRAQLFPRITLQPGVSLTAVGGPVRYAYATWTLGAGLLAPVLDRRRLLAELRAEGARADEAALAYERVVQQAVAEANGALVRLAADRARVAALDAGAGRARTAYDAQRLLFARGLVDLQPLLDAERTWRAARVLLDDARLDAARRAVLAFRALGGGWSGAAGDAS